MGPSFTKRDFGKTSRGETVELFTLRNGSGMEMSISTYGGSIVSLMVPDKRGEFADVVLGFDSVDGYEEHRKFFGALIGRYGNRIAKGRFSLDGVEYQLATNNGENHLHGGHNGFDRVIWDAVASSDAGGAGVELTYVSGDGEEGYPGTLTATVVYTLTERNEVEIAYSASTDRDTIVNLTNHSYFNLAGGGEILDHRLTLHASRFTPTDAGSIPTGELRPVAGTPFDFTEPTAIGSRIDEADEQLGFGRGYDHNWVLDKKDDDLSPAAAVYEPSSGRLMEVLTTEPGIQFYSGNFLDGSVIGKGGLPYAHRTGFCLEAQHFPDSPNRPDFPSTVLRPGGIYSQTTVYRFSVR